jgi:hypothetical protein
MVTVLRQHGLRVMIFVDDHEPAHVHVFGDGHAQINLLSDDGEPQLVWAVGMKHSEVRLAMRVVNGKQDFLQAQWRHIHG